MRTFCVLSTSFMFLFPGIVLFIDPSGILTWIVLVTYLSLHLFKKEYVYLFHRLDKISHPLNFPLLK